MSRLTLGDRVVSGTLAAVFDAIIGVAAAWLSGVYSNTLGASTATIDIKRWVLNTIRLRIHVDQVPSLHANRHRHCH